MVFGVGGLLVCLVLFSVEWEPRDKKAFSSKSKVNEGSILQLTTTDTSGHVIFCPEMLSKQSLNTYQHTMASPVLATEIS